MSSAIGHKGNHATHVAGEDTASEQLGGYLPRLLIDGERREELDPLSTRSAEWLLVLAMLAGWVGLYAALAWAIWIGLIF